MNNKVILDANFPYRFKESGKKDGFAVLKNVGFFPVPHTNISKRAERAIEVHYMRGQVKELT